MDLKQIKRIITFIISMKISIHFHGKWKALKVGAIILVIFFAILNSINISILINKLHGNENSSIDAFFYLNIALLFLIVIRNIVPFYKEVRNIIPLMAPIPDLDRIKFNFIYDNSSPFIIYIISSYIGLFVVNEFYSIKLFIISISIFISASIFNNLFRRIFFNFKQIKSSADLLLIITIFVSFAAFLTAFFLYDSNFFIFILILFNYGSYLLYKSSSNTLKDNKSIKVHSWNFKNSYFSIILGNKVTIHYLKVGLLLKVGVLSLFTLIHLTSNIYMFNLNFFWMIATPVTFFTYYLNNFLGHNKEIYLLIHLGPIQRRKTFLMYIYLALIIIGFDIPISFSFMVMNSFLSINYVLFYFIVNFLIILIGYLFTLFQIKPIDKAGSVKLSNSNISFAANLTSVTIAAIFYFINDCFLIEAIIFASLLIIAYFFFLKNDLIFNKSISINRSKRNILF